MPRRTRTRTRSVPFEEVIVDQSPKRWTRELEAGESIALPAADDWQDSRVIAWVMGGLMVLAIAHAQPAREATGIEPASMSATPVGGLKPSSVYWPDRAPGLY